MIDEQRQDIVVVDDTPDNLRLLAEMLVEKGYEVRLAPNGIHALATIRKKPPNLILLDIIMPDMDGYEVCGHLKADEQTRDIPIIFLSARNETEDKIKAFTMGGVDYITKPFQVEEVLTRVNTHLTIHRLQKKLQEKNSQLEEKNSQLEEKNEELQKKNVQLQEALNNIKTLRGLIPICANCKKIRDDEGFWKQVEIYVSEYSEAQFSHGICPDCAKKLYPTFYKRLETRRQDIMEILSLLGRANLTEIAKAANQPEKDTSYHLQIMIEHKQVKCLEVEGQNFYELP
jgi:DNA-binding response OmpR family regulator